MVLYLHFNGHFPGGPGFLVSTRMFQFWILMELRTMGVLATTGAIRRAKLQSNRHHQQMNIKAYVISSEVVDGSGWKFGVDSPLTGMKWLNCKNHTHTGGVTGGATLSAFYVTSNIFFNITTNMLSTSWTISNSLHEQHKYSSLYLREKNIVYMNSRNVEANNVGNTDHWHHSLSLHRPRQ